MTTETEVIQNIDTILSRKKEDVKALFHRGDSLKKANKELGDELDSLLAKKKAIEAEISVLSDRVANLGSEVKSAYQAQEEAVRKANKDLEAKQEAFYLREKSLKEKEAEVNRVASLFVSRKDEFAVKLKDFEKAFYGLLESFMKSF